jgi:hypothetical protein
MDTSLGGAYSIGDDQQLNYTKTAARSIPKNFADDHTVRRTGQAYMTRYVEKGRQFLQRLVRRDKTSVNQATS